LGDNRNNFGTKTIDRCKAASATVVVDGNVKLNEQLFFFKKETKGNPLRLFKTEPLQKRNGNDKLNEQVVLNKKLSSPAIIVIGEV
jgi:hypothetical protein